MKVTSNPARGYSRESALERRARVTRRTVVAAAVALVVTASTLSAGPAYAGATAPSLSVWSATIPSTPTQADAGLSPAAVEQTLRAAGAVSTAAAGAKLAKPDASLPESARSTVSTAAVTLAGGLAVKSGANTLQVRPVVEGAVTESAAGGRSEALSPSGLAVYGNTADSAFAFSKASTGGNAGYAVIAGADAPTSYRFAFTVDGSPATLRLASDGGVEVLGSTGAVVNSIAPAWAKDATGAAVPTSYSVSGNILTQSVAHAGAAYPVIADPRLRCDGLWCTLELRRSETRAVAGSVLNVGGACAVLGGGAPVCAALLVAGWAQANIALANGQCIGVRVWQANFVSYAHLAYVGCYA